MRVGTAPRPVGVLSTGQIESEILRLSEALETGTEEYAVRIEAEANAEVKWKQCEATAMLRSDQKSEALRKAEAIQIHAEAHRDYRIAGARASAQAEVCRTLRAQLDSLRTLAANARGLA